VGGMEGKPIFMKEHTTTAMSGTSYALLQVAPRS
jgi:hypothetical protein